MKQKKTNAMRQLDAKKVNYTPHWYAHDKNESVDGVHVASKLNQPFDRVYKTLVTHQNKKAYYVFMIPVKQELNLKKCARAAGVKSLEMLALKDLLPTTGYIRGGCSPIGMKKEFPVFIQEQASQYETIYFSGGQIGTQIEMDPKDCVKHLHFQMADLIM